jgi:hypothetical protein
MKIKEVLVHDNKRPNINVKKIISISSKIDWDEKCLVAIRHFLLDRHYNLPYHYILIDSSMF